jgi:hypothetical protein
MVTRRHNSKEIGPPVANEQIAAALREIARLLEQQAGNPFRIRAYRAAAASIARMSRPLDEVLEREGVEGLRQLPGVGESIALSIDKLIRTGRLPRLERLRSELRRQDELTSMPGVGRELAERIRDELGIETLEELEVAAYDGRLDNVPGMGRKRIRAIRTALAVRFQRGPEFARSRAVRPPDEPPVEELLDLDRQYREQAAQGQLHRAAPRRFNPTGAAWLPVLQAERGPRRYTVLFSNSARAHEMGATHNWVVIYRDDPGQHGQWTVITSRYGPLRGKRIVRGREQECAQYYAGLPSQRLLPLE